jgi:hypothetical protein
MIGREKQGDPLRVLHCSTTTGEHTRGLAKAERQWGLQSPWLPFCESFCSV